LPRGQGRGERAGSPIVAYFYPWAGRTAPHPYGTPFTGPALVPNPPGARGVGIKRGATALQNCCPRERGESSGLPSAVPLAKVTALSRRTQAVYGAVRRWQEKSVNKRLERTPRSSSVPGGVRAASCQAFRCILAPWMAECGHKRGATALQNCCPRERGEFAKLPGRGTARKSSRAFLANRRIVVHQGVRWS
jgi:hypothetical protein